MLVISIHIKITNYFTLLQFLKCVIVIRGIVYNLLVTTFSILFLNKIVLQ